MPDNLQIRAVEQDDLPALLGLYRQLNPSDPALDLSEATKKWQALQAYSGSTIFVGIANNLVVTTCKLVVIPNLTRGGASIGLIENVVTDTEHRNRGYGRQILQAAISAAWVHECYKVMLLTGSTNPATLKFYENCGFEQNKTGYQIRRVAPR